MKLKKSITLDESLMNYLQRRDSNLSRAVNETVVDGIRYKVALQNILERIDAESEWYGIEGDIEKIINQVLYFDKEKTYL